MTQQAHNCSLSLQDEERNGEEETHSNQHASVFSPQHQEEEKMATMTRPMQMHMTIIHEYGDTDADAADNEHAGLTTKDDANHLSTTAHDI